MGSWIELVIFHKHTVPAQTDATLLGVHVTCYVRLYTPAVACCYVLMGVVSQCLKLVKPLAPCKPTKHCWPRVFAPVCS